MAAIDPLVGALGADLDIGTGALRLGPGGDLALVAGPAALQQRLYLRALTNRGDLLLHPDFGAGAGALVALPLTAERIAQLSDALRAQFLAEPAIAEVLDISAQAAGTQLSVDVVVRLQDAPAPLALTLSLSTTTGAIS